MDFLTDPTEKCLASLKQTKENECSFIMRINKGFSHFDQMSGNIGVGNFLFVVE